MRRALIAASALLLLLPAPAVARSCTRDVRAADVDRERGAPALTFGIGPLVQAGQIGPSPAPAVPERPAVTLAALRGLRRPGRPFLLRLNRFFWSDGEAAFERYLRLARRFASRGYRIELQVRYHPSPQQEGDLRAWRAHVRRVVRRFGAIRRVVAFQIGNETNLPFSPDSSDGAYARARAVVVAGVIAAKREVRRLRLRRLGIGFNWFWRLDPASEREFWDALRERGGPRFAHAVDWVGLDVYPGTVFPVPLEPGGERDAIVTALASLRCFAGRIGIGRDVPIKVEENGWPTAPPARGYDDQVRALKRMVRAVHDFRGTFGVSDYRWFNLRDADTDSPLLFPHFGLLESDGDRKPAFGVYRRLVHALG